MARQWGGGWLLKHHACSTVTPITLPYRVCFINPGKTLEACIWGFARPEGLRGFEICTTTAASRVWHATIRSYIPSSAVCTPPTTATTIFEPLSVLALGEEDAK
ncbi:hypothetical protein XPA_006872 [Xanthoria parietina]